MTEKLFYCPTELKVGSGVLSGISEVVKDYGPKGFLVMDPFFENSELHHHLLSLLKDKEIYSYAKVTPNPRTNEIDEGAKLCKEFNASFIIGLGGGSALDSAKAINIVATNDGCTWDYVRKVDGSKEITKPLLPLIVIPTTSGTGSEATRYSVITNSETHEKATIKSDLNFPKHAFVDPDLTKTMPRKTTALTGIDAFAHCFESYIGSKANEFSEMFSLQGMKLFIRSIEKACLNGDDISAREDMCMCSVLGGLSITHSATTLPHGIGQALSGVTDAPHGGSIAVCMGEVIRWTLPEGKEKFAEVACMFKPDLSSLSIDQQANALPDILDDLFIRIIGEKVTMASYGLTKDKVDDVVKMAINNYHGDLSRHPKVASENDLKEIILKCLD